MYGGDCDAAIAEAAAAVTHVQSQSQEVGSGDEGLGLLCFDLSSEETDFGGWRTSSRDFASSLLGNCKTLLTQKHTQHVLR